MGLDLNEVLAALETAKHTIRLWHGMGAHPEAFEEQLWNIYQASPEMKQINRAIELVQSFIPIKPEGKAGDGV